ncbi:MAG: GntG family PLP-dependent aldolase [Candidatus Latescibacterota bacterium]|nr:GntG family PLP-dependent aldolase [Candidatus Latescibacterota bacterium]
MRKVDLRSDTLTLPTENMREEMAKADVGDDVYGEDPTVRLLEDLAAETVGMEAALFVPSGAMANTCALLTHSEHGNEVLFEERAHMYVWECGAFANVAGLAGRTIKSENGIILPEQLREAIRGDNVHFAKTTLLCIENTHNNYAGSAWSPQQVKSLSLECEKQGLKLHMDGARLFNAAVAHGVSARDYAVHVDSLMFCISKGLSAPVGSLLCGDRNFIDKAFSMRKRLGGAMRQSGIIAAAGIVAINQMIERLADDHARADRLVKGLTEIDGIAVERPPVSTNIVKVDFSALGWTSERLVSEWRNKGILCNPRPPHGARLVTHRHIEDDDVNFVLATTREIVG